MPLSGISQIILRFPFWERIRRKSWVSSMTFASVVIIAGKCVSGGLFEAARKICGQIFVCGYARDLFFRRDACFRGKHFYCSGKRKDPVYDSLSSVCVGNGGD